MKFTGHFIRHFTGHFTDHFTGHGAEQVATYRD